MPTSAETAVTRCTPFRRLNVDDEFLVMGRATFIDSDAIADKVRADLVGRGMTTINDELPFEFRIESVMHAKYPGGHGTWPPKYSIWKSR